MNRSTKLAAARIFVWPLAVFLALCFSLGTANASPTYRLAEAVCLDSNRAEVPYPHPIFGSVLGVGDTLCEDQIEVIFRLRSGTPAGAVFDYFRSDPGPAPVEMFSIDDGARQAFTDFSFRGLPGSHGRVTFDLSSTGGLADIRVYWDEGWFFQAGLDGTWGFGLEFGAGDGPCGLGSVAGPYPTGICIPAGRHYYAQGTYAGLTQLNEPPTLAVVLLALMLIPLARARNWNVVGLHLGAWTWHHRRSSRDRGWGHRMILARKVCQSRVA